MLARVSSYGFGAWGGQNGEVGGAGGVRQSGFHLIQTDKETRLRQIANDAMNDYADGDQAAFATLYDVLAPRLLGYLLSRTRDVAAAEDLVQQTLLQMHHARESFVRGANVLPWAFAIAHRLFIDSFRKARYREAFEQRGSEEDQDARSVDRPDDQFQAKQLEEHLERTLLSMSESQRAAFLLVKREGLSLAEAAETLGTPKTTIKMRVHYACEAIRRAMEENKGKK